MAGKAYGVTVEVSADTSKFNSQIKTLSKETKATQDELNALQKSLALEFDSEKFKRAQKIAQQALDETALKANALRDRLKHLEEAGKVDTDEYRKWQTELAKTETEAVKLKKQLEQLNKMPLDNLVKQIDKVSDGFNKAASATRGLSLAAGGALAGLGALGLKSVSVADDIATAAQKIGITSEELQKFNYIALQTDVNAEQLSKGFVKARAAIVDMAAGVQNNASKALADLKLDFSQFNNADEAFYGIIDALGKMDNQAEMLAITNEVFGDKLANELLPIIYAGGDAIAELGAEYETLGGLTNAQVDKLAAFDNVINKIKTQIQNIALQIGTALLPVMEKIAQFIQESVIPKLQKLSEFIAGLSTKQIEMGLKALAAVAMLSPLLGMIGKITGAISGVIQILPKLSGMLSSLSAHPIIAIIGVIAIILLLLYTTNEQFRESINRLIGTLAGALAPLLDIVMGLLNNLLGILQPIIDMVGNVLATALNILLDALSPVLNTFAMLFGLLEPFINIVLLPLRLQLTMLQVPLQLLGALLNWLMPLFDMFAKLVDGAFSFVLKIINTVLKAVEDAVNWVIDKINGLIRGINNLGGWLGIHINEIQKVSLQVSTGGTGGYTGGGTVDNGTPPSAEDYDYSKWLQDANLPAGGDTYNTDYDYSTKNVEQHVTVTIQNYAAEVDTDKLLNEINRKLAEAM